MSTSNVLFEFIMLVTFFGYILKTGKHAVLPQHVFSLRCLFRNIIAIWCAL